jgi:hypothetical protein
LGAERLALAPVLSQQVGVKDGEVCRGKGIQVAAPEVGDHVGLQQRRVEGRRGGGESDLDEGFWGKPLLQDRRKANTAKTRR